MKNNIINELISIEAFAEELRQRCYRARKTLEGVYSPASSGKKSKPLSHAQVAELISSRRKSAIKNAK